MPVPKTPTPARANRVPLAEVAFQYLLDEIASGNLAAGQPIEDKQVASELGISSGTVRQALGRLVEIGLVDMAPNRYTRVAEPSPARFIATITVAVSLWRLGGRLFFDRYTTDLASHFHQLVKLAQSASQPIRDGNLFIHRILDVLDFLPDNSGNLVLADMAARLRPIITHTARLGEKAFDIPGTLALLQALDEAVTNADAASLDTSLAGIDSLASEFIARHGMA